MSDETVRNTLDRALTALPAAHLGNRLRVVRTALRLSPGDLGARAGVDASLLAEVEGGRRTPSPDVLLRLARALHLEAADLLAERTPHAPFEHWAATHAVAVAASAWLAEPEDPRRFEALTAAVNDWEAAGRGPRRPEPG